MGRVLFSGLDCGWSRCQLCVSGMLVLCKGPVPDSGSSICTHMCWSLYYLGACWGVRCAVRQWWNKPLHLCAHSAAAIAAAKAPCSQLR